MAEMMKNETVAKLARILHLWGDFYANVASPDGIDNAYAKEIIAELYEVTRDFMDAEAHTALIIEPLFPIVRDFSNIGNINGQNSAFKFKASIERLDE